MCYLWHLAIVNAIITYISENVNIYVIVYYHSSVVFPVCPPCILLIPGELSPTRRYINRHFGRFFSSNFLLNILQSSGANFFDNFSKKSSHEHGSTSINLAVNTLNNCFLYFLHCADKNCARIAKKRKLPGFLSPGRDKIITYLENVMRPLRLLVS